MGKPDGKEATIEALKENLAKTKQLYPRIKLLHQLSKANREIDMLAAHAFAEEAFQLVQSKEFERKPDQHLLAASLSHLSFTHSKLNDLKSALQRGLQAVAIYETLDFSSEYAAALTTVGFSYAIFGNHAEALQYALKGIEVARAVGDLQEELHAQNSLGVAYGMAEDYEESYRYFLSCLELEAALNLESNPATLNNCSLINIYMGKYEVALDYGLRCLEAAEKANNLIMLHAGRDRVAKAYIGLGEYEKAKAYVQINLESNKISKSHVRRSHTLVNLGQILLKQQQPEQALIHLNEALAISSEENAMNIVFEALQEVVNVHEQLGNWQEAFAAHKKLASIREQLFEKKLSDKVKGLELSFQIREAEREAEIYRSRNEALQKEIQERQRAEAEAHRQAQYFKLLLDSSPIAIITTKTNFQLDDCNPAFETLFGYNKQTLLNQDLSNLFANNTTEKELKANLESLRRGETIRTTTKRPHRDGTYIDVEGYAVPIRVDGQSVGYLIMYHDIRERIAKEATLREAKVKAEAATRAKSVFLANMSHEIRTPLNGIVGMTSLLQETPLNATQQEYVQIIRNSSDGLSTIINDILDFSKIEAGKLDLENHPFDVRLVVEEVLDLLATKAAVKELEIGYLVEPALPTLVGGDVTRVRQILMNLVGNAVKFTEDGGVFVRVGQIREGNGRYQIQFAVQDSGIGIPEERMQHLFKSFSQVDTSTTRRFGGTGLGLAISRRLAQMMGGTVWVESEEGSGSTFYFSIEVTKVSGKNKTDAVLAAEPPPLANRPVLVIDSCDSHRNIICHNLKSWGMEPVAATSLAQGKAMVNEGRPFDVVLLNESAADDPNRLISTLRQLNRPFILMTARGNSKDMAEATVPYIVKPVKPSRLYNALITLFDSTPLATQTAAKPAGSITPSAVPLRLLIAEDNLINQKVALRILERLGYQADMVTNGVEVLAQLERQTYDVILMDVQMPEMDGITATRQIHKRYLAGERPYIIALTANALTGDKEQYLACGMDDYLSKPIRIEDVKDALSRFLEKMPVPVI